MITTRTVTLFGLISAAAFVGCLSPAAPADRPAVYLDAKLPIEKRIDDLLARMTLEEKIAQMDQYIVEDARSTQNEKTLTTVGIGSTLGELTPEEYNELQKLAEQARLKIPVLCGIDACHGHALMPGATVFPTNSSMAATFNPDLAFKTATLAAREVRGWGHHWIFTPTLDVTQDARFGRTGETFGECPFVTSVMADAYVRGYQGNLDPSCTVAACPKHYVGGGVSQGGCNHASAELSERTLRQVFLKPFKAAVDAGCLSIMGGHNDIAGIPAHANKWLLTDVLKKEYGFQGVVLSDMGDVRNLAKGELHSTAPDHKAALAQGMNAGVDIYMNSSSRKEFIEPMLELVNEGKVSQARVDDAVRRVLRVKFKLGLFEHRYVDVAVAHKAFGADDAQAVALQGAREAVVLLKNQGELLPLPPGKYKKIFVTGPNADNQALLGDWSFRQPDDNVTTVVEGLRAVVGTDAEIDYFNCGRIKGKPSPITREAAMTADPRLLNQKIAEGNGAINDFAIAEAGRRAAQADLAIVVIGGYGLRWEWGLRTYGESCDRPTIDLYGRQLELVKAIQASGKPVIAVIVNGPPLNEPWVSETLPAILYTMEPGMYGGQAVAEILFGKVNPSGRLPYTIPKTAGHIPQFYYAKHSRFWTGYGLGSTGADNLPAWAFGHGLSYTTFAYSKLVVPKDLPVSADIPVAVTVTNTGKVAGDHSVLLFVSDVVATVSPPIKELKGFTKIHLEPGESREVKFTVKNQSLSLWNAEMQNVVEPGEFTIAAGDQTATCWLRAGAEFSTAADVFEKEMTLEIGNFSPAGKIHVTTDGNEPTSRSPVYTKPLILRQTTTVKAAVFAGKVKLGETIRREFRKLELKAPAATAGTAKGLACKLYLGEWTALPDFAKLTPASQSIANRIALPQTPQKDNFAVQFSGYLEVPADSLYEFHLNSDDGSRLLIAGEKLIDFDGPHPEIADPPSGQIALKKGCHPIEVQYYQGTGQKSLHLTWNRPGEAPAAIPAAALSH
jgi:beta-glucosidase